MEDFVRGRRLPLLLWIAAGAVQACSGRGGSNTGAETSMGALVAKPGGGYFLSDPHQGGKATRLRLVEIGWGRLVDVHDVDAQGRPQPLAVLRDFVVDENVFVHGADMTLETNPLTRELRLNVLRPRDAPDSGTGTFTALLRRVTRLSAVLPKRADGTASLPVSFVARNATLVLRFDDLLADGPEARAALLDTVRLTTGYPPDAPHPARIVFDPSHGGIVDGEFHSTRVLVDLAVSPADALDVPYSVPVLPAGLPASSTLDGQPNGALRLPTRLDPASGRFARLANLSGRGLEPDAPLDPASGDLVRAFRSGNREDTNAGYLLDLVRPRILSSWEIALEDAAQDPGGPAGFGFVVALTFRTPCRAAPRRGDVLELGGELYEVRRDGPPPSFHGRVADVQLLRRESGPAVAAALLGLGRYATPFSRELPLEPACWLTFEPPPLRPPSRGIATDARIRVRFDEPVDPDSVRAFDTLRVLRESQDDDVLLADDLIVGSVRVDQDLQGFTFLPRLPLANRDELVYRLELLGGAIGVRDLAGGRLADSFTRADFELADGQPERSNGGFVLRFASPDEAAPRGLNDVRGQVAYAEDRGRLVPRPTTFASHAADRSNPLVNRMAPWAFGVRTPLSPLGSKLQALWRYCDFGFNVRDESFYNLDVIGLSWSPVGGALIADFFPEFELRLAHAAVLPDETTLVAALQPRYSASGLPGAPRPFAANVLQDARVSQVVVHPRALGYQVRPADLTRNGAGTPLVPFPWNRSGAPLTTFTWRDTAVLARASVTGPGVPLDIEVGAPLGLDNTGIGTAAPPAALPTFALPLLWEVRCYPTTTGLGFNALDIRLAVPWFPTPNFRVFSSGGIDHLGNVVRKNPDLELVPSGAFNAASTPPGLPTWVTGDNSFYIGSIDTVVRVSRAVTVWIDTGAGAPRFVEPLFEPPAQPGRSAVVAEYRGADGFSTDAGDAPFDASVLDAYGEFPLGAVAFHGDGTWSGDIRAVDGARFLQARFSFLNDIESRLSPELDSFAVAFEH